MKIKKRAKNTRIRGARTCGYGFRQKHKGHGSKGGHGMAGSGKRADHKKQKALNMDTKNHTYFGHQGLTSRHAKKKSGPTINLADILRNFSGAKIDLSKYKILGNGAGFKAEITAKSATASAIEKMQGAGGKIILTAKPKAIETPLINVKALKGKK